MSERFNAGVAVVEQSAPSTPASGLVEIYAKTDRKLYIKDSTGAETDLTATGAAGGSEVFAFFAG